MFKLFTTGIIFINLFFPYCMAFPSWENIEFKNRKIEFKKDSCIGNNGKLIFTSSAYSVFVVDKSEIENRENNFRAGLTRQVVRPSEIVMNFKNQETIKEIGIYIGMGNFRMFESENFKYVHNTGGYSLSYKGEIVCKFDKHDHF